MTRFDDGTGVAWFAVGAEVFCIDRVSLWNNAAGGVDEVLVAIADCEADAQREIERVRPR